MAYIIFIIGISYFIMGIILDAANFKSKLVFKAAPILSGLFLMLYAAKQLGWVA